MLVRSGIVAVETNLQTSIRVFYQVSLMDRVIYSQVRISGRQPEGRWVSSVRNRSAT